jgi:hypothetical protein
MHRKVSSLSNPLSTPIYMLIEGQTRSDVCLNPAAYSHLRQASTAKPSWASCSSPPKQRRRNRIYTQCFRFLRARDGGLGVSPRLPSRPVLFSSSFRHDGICISTRDLPVAFLRSACLHLAFFFVSVLTQVVHVNPARHSARRAVSRSQGSRSNPTCYISLSLSLSLSILRTLSTSDVNTACDTDDAGFGSNEHWYYAARPSRDSTTYFPRVQSLNP